MLQCHLQPSPVTQGGRTQGQRSNSHLTQTTNRLVVEDTRSGRGSNSHLTQNTNRLVVEDTRSGRGSNSHLTKNLSSARKLPYQKAGQHIRNLRHPLAPSSLSDSTRVPSWPLG